jgi:hypothetical protein
MKKPVSSEHYPPWISPKDGWFISTGGHMHDGGESWKLYHDDKMIFMPLDVRLRRGA